MYSGIQCNTFSSLAIKEPADIRLAHAKSQTDVSIGISSTQGQNLNYLFTAKSWMAEFVASFSYHILSIVLHRSKLQMARIDARRVVAFVEDAVAMLNRTVVNHPAYSMARQLLKWMNALVKNAVTLVASLSSPFPTWAKFRAMCWYWAAFVYTFPEAFKNRFGKALRDEPVDSSFVLHNQVSFGLPRSGLFVQRRGNSYPNRLTEGVNSGLIFS